jgi:hypothetical protein
MESNWCLQLQLIWTHFFRVHCIFFFIWNSYTFLSLSWYEIHCIFPFLFIPFHFVPFYEILFQKGTINSSKLVINCSRVRMTGLHYGLSTFLCTGSRLKFAPAIEAVELFSPVQSDDRHQSIWLFDNWLCHSESRLESGVGKLWP